MRHLLLFGLIPLSGCSPPTMICTVCDAGLAVDGGVADSGPPADAGVSTDAGAVADAGGTDRGASADAGLAIGENCATSSECAESRPAATATCFAYGNGPARYCIATCTLPGDRFPAAGLPHADCPPRAVCVSTDFSVPASNPIGACVPECSTDGDCRVSEGFFCRRRFFLAGGVLTTTNGYCAPAHCQSRACPERFHCSC